MNLTQNSKWKRKSVAAKSMHFFARSTMKTRPTALKDVNRTKTRFLVVNYLGMIFKITAAIFTRPTVDRKESARARKNWSSDSCCPSNKSSTQIIIP